MMNYTERLATVNLAEVSLEELVRHALDVFLDGGSDPHRADLAQMITGSIEWGRERIGEHLAEVADLFDGLGINMAAVLDIGPLPVMPSGRLVDTDTGEVETVAPVQRTWRECYLADLAETIRENAHRLGQVYTADQAEYILKRRAVIVADRRKWKAEVKKIEADMDQRIQWLKEGGDPELAALAQGLFVAESRKLRAEGKLARWMAWWWPSLETLARNLMADTKAKSWSCPWGTIKKSKVTRMVKKPVDRENMDFAVDWAEGKGFLDAIKKELMISKVPRAALDAMTDEEAGRNGFDVRPEHEKVELDHDEDED